MAIIFEKIKVSTSQLSIENYSRDSLLVLSLPDVLHLGSPFMQSRKLIKNNYKLIENYTGGIKGENK